MPLLGKGLLAIWNDIAPDAENDFVEWHVREHIPERVSVPGFRRGRRYIAETGRPKYFNFYETDTPEVLSSQVYTDRLNSPSEWTRRVVAHFRDTSRTVCSVAATYGTGIGTYVSAIRIAPATDGETFRSAMVTGVIPATLRSPGVVGAHLLEGQKPITGQTTAESKLRSMPDRTISWLYLVEAIDLDAIVRAARSAYSPANLAKSGAPEDFVERGIYRLQYALSGEELRAADGSR